MFEGTRPWNADKPHATDPVFSFCYFPPYVNLSLNLNIHGPDFSFRASHVCWSRREVARAIATGGVRDLRRMSLY